MMSPLRNARVIGLCLVMELANCASGLAQNGQTGAAPPNSQELNGKIELLTRSLEQTQTELARSRSEIEQLRAMLGEVGLRRHCLRKRPARALRRHRRPPWKERKQQRRFRRTIGTC